MKRMIHRTEHDETSSTAASTGALSSVGSEGDPGEADINTHATINARRPQSNDSTLTLHSRATVEDEASGIRPAEMDVLNVNPAVFSRETSQHNDYADKGSLINSSRIQTDDNNFQSNNSSSAPDERQGLSVTTAVPSATTDSSGPVVKEIANATTTPANCTGVLAIEAKHSSAGLQKILRCASDVVHSGNIIKTTNMPAEGGYQNTIRTVTADSSPTEDDPTLLRSTGGTASSSPTQDVAINNSINENVCPSQTQLDTAEEERIRNEEISIDQKKLKLYMEAIKAHGNRGGDRIFSDYWDAVCRYLSTGNNIRSNSDKDSDGFEAQLKSFLTTKKLRKLHNSLVKALMKQCYQTRASENRIGNHVPLKWRAKVVKIARKQNSGLSPATVCDPISISQEFSIQSSAFQNSGSNAITADRFSQFEVPVIESNHFESPRLPGVLEIDHLSQQLQADNDELYLSKAAQWVAVIAIREFVANIVQKAIIHFEAKIASNESRKRRRLSNYDFSQVMDDAVSHTDHFPFPASSRIAWEHFTLNSKSSLVKVSNIDLENYQSTIYHLMEEATTNRIESKQKSPSRPASSGGRSFRLGKGKDLMAMKARQSKPNVAAAPTQEEVDLKAMISDQQEQSPSEMSVASPQFGDMYNQNPFTQADPYNRGAAMHRASVVSIQNALKQIQHDSIGNNAVMGMRNPADLSINGNNQADLSISRNLSPMNTSSQNGSVLTSASFVNAIRTHRTAPAAIAVSAVEALHMPHSTSSSVSRRPNSAGSSSRRGRGAKDLKRMFARNKK